MLGYLDDPEATSAAIDSEGWLHTGDVGAIDEAGNLTITDRLKDMYISGGFNVYPAEVEQVLARLEGVVESAVIGVPDERLGEVGKAFIVTKPGATLDERRCNRLHARAFGEVQDAAIRSSSSTSCPAILAAKWSSHC